MANGLCGWRRSLALMSVAGLVSLAIWLVLAPHDRPVEGEVVPPHIAWSHPAGWVLGLLFGVGVANMAFIIPSQTLFQERTPPELMARVVSLRFAIVFGVMTIATAALGLVANVTGVGPVVALAGVISIVAGVAGYFVPAVRDA